MAYIKHLVDLDLSKNQLLNAVVQNLAVAPTSPADGQIYWDTADDTLYVWNADGSAWIDLGSDGITNLDYTAGVSNGVVTSDTGTDATIPLADASNAGLFSAAEKTKLGNIEASATADQIASEVPSTASGNLAATNVQDALNELQGDIDTLTTNASDDQTLSISTNEITISEGNSITLYDQTLNTTDDVEFNDVVADRLYLDPQQVAGSHIGLSSSQYSKSTANAGFIAGAWTELHTEPTASSSLDGSAAIFMARMKGAFKGRNITGSNHYARTQGTDGFSGTAIAINTIASYRGSDPNGNNGTNFVIGANLNAEVKDYSSGNLEYLRGANIEANHYGGSTEVEWLQGLHVNGGLYGSGTVDGGAQVVFLDWDEDATGTINGDFAYLQINNDTVSGATGTKRAINSVSTYPSEFGGSLESTSFIKTGGTSAQFLKADGSVDTNTYLTSGTLSITNDLGITHNASNVDITINDGADIVLNAATGSIAGAMTGADKTKLDGITTGANVNVTTDISIDQTGASQVVVESSDGTDGTITAATGSVAGVMTSADKTKLDGIATGAQVNVAETVTSIAIASNILTYTDENGSDTDIDLSLYLDDTNLSRLTSGSINGSTGLATFTRSDSTTFTIDMSDFLDGITVNNTLTSTSTTEGLSAAQGKVLKDLIDGLNVGTGSNTGDEVQATTTVKGIAEIATQTEVNTGSDNSRIVTPATLKSTLGITASLSTTLTYSELIGNASATSIAVTHSIGNQFVQASVYEVADGMQMVECEIELTSASITTFKFNVAPTSNQYRVVIIG